MSAGYHGKRTNGAQDAIGTSQNDERLSTWGEIPGKVVSFDPATGTATVQPLYKPVFNGKAVDMPQLYEVPVRMQRGGNGALTFPVQASDSVTLRPQMRSSENYHTSGDGSPSDARSFSLADMEAHLDGGDSLTNPLPNYDPNNMHLRFSPDGKFGIRGSADGKIKIEGAQGDAYAILTDMVKRTGEGFSLLGTEPGLIHRGQYAQIGADLLALEAKLRGMAL